MAESIDVLTDNSVTLPFSRRSVTHNRCIICKSSTPLVIIPYLAKLRVFINKRILITEKSRCCKRHLKGDYFKEEEMNRIRAVSDTTTLTAPEISELLNELCKCAQRGLLDFENSGALTDTDYYRLTGLSGLQFNNIFKKIDGEIRSTSGRGARTCLAILLVKLKTGLSHSLLSTFFGLPKRKIGRAIHSARKAMMKSFVPFVRERT